MSFLLELELPKNEEPNAMSAGAVEASLPVALMCMIISTGWPFMRTRRCS